MSIRSPHPPLDALNSRRAWALVRQVARSFALSLQILPATMRWPVALAYLLARSSDTIADSAKPGSLDDPFATQRLGALSALDQAIRGSTDHHAHHPPPVGLDGIIRLVPSASERELLQHLPDWLCSLRELPEPDRKLIVDVCSIIIEGQRMDLERFETKHPDSVQSLRTTEELEHYTWQVAGCVGSFWSLVCEAHHPGWREAALDRMVDAGVKYGLGLQRLNLLRDTSEDLALGRCYWPDEELASVGMDAQKLVCAVKDRDMLALIPMLPLMKTWIHQTRAGLSLGIAYGNGITSWRLRAASALPALIGLQTLNLIEKAGVSALVDPVKVPRSWVRGLLWKCLTGSLSRRGLPALGKRLGADSPLLERALS